MIVPVLPCGGMDSRLRPVFRASQPKQAVNLLNEKSLLLNTMSRLSGIETGVPILIYNRHHRF